MTPWQTEARLRRHRYLGDHGVKNFEKVNHLGSFHWKSMKIPWNSMKIPWNPWNRVESMKFHWKSTNIHETHEHKLTSMKTREHLSFWSSTGNFEGPTITRSWFLTTIGRGIPTIQLTGPLAHFQQLQPRPFSVNPMFRNPAETHFQWNVPSGNLWKCHEMPTFQ